MIIIEITYVYTIHAPITKTTTCNLNPCITKAHRIIYSIYASYYWLMINQRAKFLTQLEQVLYWAKDKGNGKEKEKESDEEE